jgi:hypothetical protein
MSRIVSYRRYFLTAVLALSLAAASCSPLISVTLGPGAAETLPKVAKVTPLEQPFDGAQDRAQDSATATPAPTPIPLPASALKVETTEIEVGQSGPADKAGLQGSTETVEIKGRPLPTGGDIIMAIDGTPIQDMDDVIVYLMENTRPGQEVELSILRNGQEQKLTIELGERPESVTR